MYRSESHFSKQLCLLLQDKIMYQRIESGETGIGIPDLWLRWPSMEVWVELKNHNYLSIREYKWKIKWRRGQQGWAIKYHRVCGKCTYTIVAMKDGYIIIPMTKRYTNNIVFSQDVWIMTKLQDIWKVLNDTISV